MTSLLRFLRSYTGLWLLLAFTLLIRGGLLFVRCDQLRADPDDYNLIAHNLVRRAVFSDDDPARVDAPRFDPRPSAFRPPLYPVLLSNLAVGKDLIIYRELIAALHLALGLATVWLTWLIARALQLGWGSYLAGALVACDPILLNQQSLVMTETLAALCTVVAWALLVRFHFDRNWWNAALAGGAIGLAALCRPTFLPWLAMASVVALLLEPGRYEMGDKQSRRPARDQINLRMLNAVALLVAGLGVMFPWAWRNYQVFGKPLLTTTHGGYTLYLANNRHFYSYLRNDWSGLPWDPETETVFTEAGLRSSLSFPQERNGLLYGALAPEIVPDDNRRELVLDRIQSAKAREEMRSDPLGLILASLYRIRQLWTPLPYKLTADESLARCILRYLTAAWYLGVYALVAGGVYRLRTELLRSPWIWGVLLCLIFTGIHAFYWCNLRMRAPLMPIVAVVAAAGATGNLNRPKQAQSQLHSK